MSQIHLPCDPQFQILSGDRFGVKRIGNSNVPIDQQNDLHSGVDLRPHAGGGSKNAYSVLDGLVTVNTSALGSYIQVDHGIATITDKFGSSRTGHIQSLYVDLAIRQAKVGQRVLAGEKVGDYSSHLHFTLICDGVKIDPEPYLSSGNQPFFDAVNIIQGSGFQYSLYHNTQGLFVKILSGETNGLITITRSVNGVDKQINGVTIYTSKGKHDRLVVTAPLLPVPYIVTIAGNTQIYTGHLSQPEPVQVINPEPVIIAQEPVIEVKPEPVVVQPTPVQVVVPELSQPVEKPKYTFIPRSKEVKAFLGYVKNNLPSISLALLYLGVNQDTITMIVSFTGSAIAGILAFYFELDKTNYNEKEKANQ